MIALVFCNCVNNLITHGRDAADHQTDLGLARGKARLRLGELWPVCAAKRLLTNCVGESIPKTKFSLKKRVIQKLFV